MTILFILALYSNLSFPYCNPRSLSALNIISTRTVEKFWHNSGQALLLYWKNKSLKLTASGFHNSRTTIVKWTTRGLIFLVIPGHDPPLEITIFMDIAKNPGPTKQNTEDRPLKLRGNFNQQFKC